MRTSRPNPRRGLLAGVTALIAFASAAVGMTAGGPSGVTTTARSAQAVVASVTNQARATEAVDGADTRDEDGRGHHR